MLLTHVMSAAQRQGHRMPFPVADSLPARTMSAQCSECLQAIVYNPLTQTTQGTAHIRECDPANRRARLEAMKREVREVAG